MSVLRRHAGIKFSTAGRLNFRYRIGTDAKNALQRLCESLGGEFGNLDKRTRYIIASAANKTVRRLLESGDGVEMIAPNDVCRLFDLSADEIEELIRAGEEGQRAFDAIRQAWSFDAPELPPLDNRDLSGADLRGWRLQVSMRGVDFSGCNASGAEFIGNMCGASLKGADFSGATLRHVSLARADLTGANLSGAELTTVDATDAAFAGVNLSGATVRAAKLVNCDLRSAQLAGTTLHDITGGDFSGLDLSSAKLAGVVKDCGLRDTALHLERAVDFIGCDLRGADLRDCMLLGADLSTSDLEGADFEGANVAFALLAPMSAKATVSSAVGRLVQAITGFQISTSVTIERADAVATLTIRGSNYSDTVSSGWSVEAGSESTHNRSLDLRALSRRFTGTGKVRIDKVKVKVNRSGWPQPEKKPREYKQLARDAWAELLGVDSMTEKAVKARRSEHAQFHASKTKKLDELGEEKLLQAIEKDPQSDEAWLVYADWLQVHGDVRGEIIVREHAAAGDAQSEDEIAAYVRSLRETLLGDLAAVDCADFGLRRGFIDSITVRPSAKAAKVLERLLDHPAARFARSLTSSTAAAKAMISMHELIEKRPITSLSLAHSRYADAEALAAHTKLRKLNIAYAPMRDLSSLANLTNLEDLTISGPHIRTVGFLAALKKLRHLSMYSTGVSDVSPLAGLPELRSITMPGTRAHNIEVLDACPKLERLIVTDGSDVGRLLGKRNLEVRFTPWF